MIDWSAIGTVLAGGALAGGVVRSGFNLKSRVDGHDTLFVEREKQAVAQHNDLKEDLKEIKDLLYRREYGQTAR